MDDIVDRHGLSSSAAISDIYSKGGFQESDEEDDDSANWWKKGEEWKD